MVSAQSMNRKITIQEPTESTNSDGIVTQTWTTYYQPMARVLPAIGREYLEAKQFTSSQSVRFQLHYCEKAKSITPKMRVLYDGKTYDIESTINAFEQNREIVLQTVLNNA